MIGSDYTLEASPGPRNKYFAPRAYKDQENPVSGLFLSFKLLGDDDIIAPAKEYGKQVLQCDATESPLNVPHSEKNMGSVSWENKQSLPSL